ncbi:hypothetical protein ACLOAV_005668 [Pseudogymnoascus australis]
MATVYKERWAVTVDLETNVAASPLADRMLGLQETTLAERMPGLQEKALPGRMPGLQEMARPGRMLGLQERARPGRMFGLQETALLVRELSEREKKAPKTPAFAQASAQASGIGVAVVAPL